MRLKSKVVAAAGLMVLSFGWSAADSLAVGTTAQGRMTFTVSCDRVEGRPAVLELVARENGPGDDQIVARCRVAELPGVDSCNPAPVLVISQHGDADTLHICYRWQNGIYYQVSTNWLNPERIRQGVVPEWTPAMNISRSSAVAASPVSGPTLEVSEPAPGINYITVTWQGSGGDVWRRERLLGGLWANLYNIGER